MLGEDNERGVSCELKSSLNFSMYLVFANLNQSERAPLLMSPSFVEPLTLQGAITPQYVKNKHDKLSGKDVI